MPGDDKKPPICPLISACDSGFFERCVRGDCGWWLAERERCAVAHLADSLERLCDRVGGEW